MANTISKINVGGTSYNVYDPDIRTVKHAAGTMASTTGLQSGGSADFYLCGKVVMCHINLTYEVTGAGSVYFGVAKVPSGFMPSNGLYDAAIIIGYSGGSTIQNGNAYPLRIDINSSGYIQMTGKDASSGMTIRVNTSFMYMLV